MVRPVSSSCAISLSSTFAPMRSSAIAVGFLRKSILIERWHVRISLLLVVLLIALNRALVEVRIVWSCYGLHFNVLVLLSASRSSRDVGR